MKKCNYWLKLTQVQASHQESNFTFYATYKKCIQVFEHIGQVWEHLIVFNSSNQIKENVITLNIDAFQMGKKKEHFPINHVRDFSSKFYLAEVNLVIFLTRHSTFGKLLPSQIWSRLHDQLQHHKIQSHHIDLIFLNLKAGLTKLNAKTEADSIFSSMSMSQESFKL